MICYICNKNVYICRNHLSSCAKQHNITSDKTELTFNMLKHNFPDISICEEFFIEYYIKREYSLPDFKKEFKLAYKQTQFFLNYFHIPIRNISVAKKTTNSKNKYRDTCIRKYGVENVSQTPENKEKKKKTFSKNYGVDNIQKSIEYYKWLNEYMIENYGKKRITDIKKIKEYYNTRTEEEKNTHNMNISIRNKEWQHNLCDDKKNEVIEKLRRYHDNLGDIEKQNLSKKISDGLNKYQNSLSTEEKSIVIEKRLTASFKKRSLSSSLEIRFQKILNNFGIGYITQFKLNRYYYDVKINNSNIIIEINGDYWHANPNFYEKNDIISMLGGVKTAEYIQNKDSKKKEFANSLGYNVIYIQEEEMKKITDKQLIDLFLLKLKNFD